MISILVITHYSLGDSYRQITTHFFGENIPTYIVLGSDKLDTPEGLLSKVQQAIDHLPTEQPVLVLTDVFGATPCNILNHVDNPRPISIITGLNVPMLVKALQDMGKYSDVTELSVAVAKAAKDGIITCNIG